MCRSLGAVWLCQAVALEARDAWPALGAGRRAGGVWNHWPALVESTAMLRALCGAKLVAG